MIITQKMTGKRAAARMLALLLRLLGRRDILLRLVGRQAHLLDDRVGAGLDPAAIVGRVLLEMRQDRLADDDARHGVGHVSAGAIAGRDPDLALVGRDQQQDAVVVLFLRPSSHARPRR